MPTLRRTTRRTALVGLTAGLTGGLTSVLSGCDTDDLRPPRAGASVTPSAAPGRSTPDEALVTEAVSAIRSTSAVVVSARKVQTLRRPLAPLMRDHRLHLAALDEEPEVGDTPAAGDATTALAAVRAGEQNLQQQLVDFAVRAESGTLAALLASMSASIGQHLATLGTAS